MFTSVPRGEAFDLLFYHQNVTDVEIMAVVKLARGMILGFKAK
jgi:hypothetical protein